jgi:tRNA 2-selenouridine synthase
MTARVDTDDYRALFLQHTPMIDLRAPAEFARGAFPGSISLPLMTDEERAQVGICYKQQGQEAAIKLGHELVAGDIKAERLAAWTAFIESYPECVLYCWRGGLRSQTVQLWLKDAGVECPRVRGGYKAMRQYLLEELRRSIDNSDIVLISGKTGTGKTRVVERLVRCIDLEGLANHRGSTFGQMPTPQPAQIDFENSLSIQFLRLLATHAPMLVVEQTLDERVDMVLKDYIVDLGQRYTLSHGEEGAHLHAEKMLYDLSRIQRRLGGDRYKKMQHIMQQSFEEQRRSGDITLHREWIAFLLSAYYDPMYAYQLDKRGGERLFRGDRDSVLEKAREMSSIAGAN